MSFADKLKVRQSSAEKPCDCWDHLRADGLTPPLSERHRHRVVGTEDEGGIVKGSGVDVPIGQGAPPSKKRKRRRRSKKENSDAS